MILNARRTHTRSGRKKTKEKGEGEREGGRKDMRAPTAIRWDPSAKATHLKWRSIPSQGGTNAVLANAIKWLNWFEPPSPTAPLYLAAAKLISGLDRWDQRDDQCCPLPHCQGHTWFITQHKFCSNFYNTSARKLRCQAWYLCVPVCVCVKPR